jgi:hypothetical protein
LVNLPSTALTGTDRLEMAFLFLELLGKGTSTPGEGASGVVGIFE